MNIISQGSLAARLKRFEGFDFFKEVLTPKRRGESPVGTFLCE
jgi:hypothetical protein